MNRNPTALPIPLILALTLGGCAGGQSGTDGEPISGTCDGGGSGGDRCGAGSGGTPNAGAGGRSAAGGGTPAAESDAATGADGSGSPPPVEAGGAPGADSCAVDGPRLVLRGAFEAVSTNAVASDDSEGRGIDSVKGDIAGGDVVYWRRAGDVSDAAINEVGTFDAADYPNNVHVLLGVVATRDLRGFFGTSGTLTVTQVRPVFRATFHLESLRDASGPEFRIPGDPIEGVVDGCIAVPVEQAAAGPGPAPSPGP